MTLTEPASAAAPPVDRNPIFSEPWEAHAFALTIDLHGRGLFSWKDWTRTLAAEIAAAQAAGDPDHGDTYFRHWLAALEAIVAAKGLASHEELTRCQSAWARAADRTPHGQPIELQPRDFSVPSVTTPQR